MTPEQLKRVQQSVWYVEAGRGRDTQMGSGVAVWLRNESSNQRFLLTCRHVLRKGKVGPLIEEIRCWKHGEPYAPSGSERGGYKCTIRHDIWEVPKDAGNESELCGVDDWVILEFDAEEIGSGAACVADWGEVDENEELTVIGFPGGPDRSKGLQTLKSIDARRGRPRPPKAGVFEVIGGEDTRAGMSGGPCLDDQLRLIGLHRKRDDLRRIRGAVQVSLIRDKLAANGWEVVQSPAAAAKKVIGPPASELAAYFVDFSSQDQAFRRCIEIHRGRDAKGKHHPARNRPLVVLVPGWINDFTSDYLLDRLLYELKYELRRYDDNYKALELGHIPPAKHFLDCNGSESLESIESLLVEKIRKARFFDHSIPSDPDRAGEYIKNYTFTEPIIFFAHLELAEMKGGDPLSFVQRFCEFWGSWGDQNHLLLICIFISYLKTPCTVWERAMDLFRGHERINKVFNERLRELHPTAHGAVKSAVLPTLEPVCKRDVTNWARLMKERGVLKHDADLCIQRRINELFANRKVAFIRGRLPIHDLCGHLDDYLIECQSDNTP